MNSLIRILPLAVLLLAPPVAAQTESQLEAEQHARELREAEEQHARELREAEEDHAQALREAEAELAEVAQRVAELSMRNLPDVQMVENMVMDLQGGRPRMGVTIATERPERGPVEGVEIVGVTPGSAAAEAGIRSGDVLTSINGEELAADKRYDANGRLIEVMKRVDEGDKLDIEYLRDGNVGRVTVVPRVVDNSVFVFSGPEREALRRRIQVIPDELGNSFRSWAYRIGGSWADMELVELNEGLGKYFGTDQGVLVVSAPKSGALDLEDGDVIQSIDGREPTSVNHALRILGSYQPGEGLELSIMREKRRRTLDVTIPDDRTSFVPAAPLAPRVETPPTPVVLRQALAPAAPVAVRPVPAVVPIAPEPPQPAVR